MGGRGGGRNDPNIVCKYELKKKEKKGFNIVFLGPNVNSICTFSSKCKNKSQLVNTYE
jgi:hypothetical protein